MTKQSKLPRISRTALNERMKELPSPVQEHSLRTKRLAAYLLERVAAEEWFIESGYNAQSLVSAVYYHDIGKLNLAMDDLYLLGRTNEEKRSRYYAHTQEGLAVIQQELNTDLAAYSERSFGGILRRVVGEHHKAFTETGSTDENFERAYTLPGNLTAVADSFDNLLFVGKGDRGDLDEAAAALQERAGKDLDPDLVEALLSDMTALEAFVGTLVNSWTYKRRQDRFGIGFTFRPLSPEDPEARMGPSLLAEPFLNDIYYGRIKTAAFLSVAEEGDTIFSLELISLEHLASLARRLEKTGSIIPDLLYEISARQLEHPTFLRRTASILERYQVPPSKLTLALRDPDITGFHVDAAAFRRQVHEEGMAFAITDLGEDNSVLTKISEIAPDKVILSEKVPPSLTGGILEELKKSGITPLKASAPFEECDLPFRLLEVMCNESN